MNKGALGEFSIAHTDSCDDDVKLGLMSFSLMAEWLSKHFVFAKYSPRIFSIKQQKLSSECVLHEKLSSFSYTMRWFHSTVDKTHHNEKKNTPTDNSRKRDIVLFTIHNFFLSCHDQKHAKKKTFSIQIFSHFTKYKKKHKQQKKAREKMTQNFFNLAQLMGHHLVKSEQENRTWKKKNRHE